MRMWMVDPATMCRQHLLGEHVETHMFAGTLAKDISVAGYVTRGLLETASLASRHDALAAEMERRGYQHRSPLNYHDDLDLGRIDTTASDRELRSRCPDCASRQEF